CVEALCPGNKKVLGGGGSWRAGDKVLANTHSFVGQGWVICIAEPGVHEITVQAHCANTTLQIKDETKTSASDANQGGCTSVECPSGFEPISGGFVTSVPYATDTNRTHGNGWNVCGVASDTGTRNARVLCIDEDARVITREKQSLHQGLGGGGRECLIATCPAGKTVLSGGGEFNDVSFDRNAPVSGQEAWEVCGTSEASTAWTAHAVC
ncbi:unnamed protein product, partial [Laminaria digitata]